MKSLFPVTMARSDDGTAQVRLQERVLTRLIAFSFASWGPTYSFRDAFHDFVDAYFTLATEGGFSFEAAVGGEQAIDALAEAFDEAIADGQLAPLPVSTRLAAAAMLASLNGLRGQVRDGVLTPGAAADLVATIFFEGLQSPWTAAR